MHAYNEPAQDLPMLPMLPMLPTDDGCEHTWVEVTGTPESIKQLSDKIKLANKAKRKRAKLSRRRNRTVK